MKFLDRYGHLRTLPEGKSVTKRTGVYGLCVRDKKILLIQTAFDGLWEVPGGGVDEGENFDEALRREFLEETGFVIDDYEKKIFKRFVKYTHDVIHDSYFRQEYLYFSILKLGRQNMESVIRGGKDKGDIIERIEWVPVGRLHEAEFHKIHRVIVHDYLTYLETKLI